MTFSQKQQIPHRDLVMCHTVSYSTFEYKRFFFNVISNGMHHSLNMQHIIFIKPQL